MPACVHFRPGLRVAEGTHAQTRTSHSMTSVLLLDRRHAFGKTSIASTGDIDFFLPDTGPLSTESYRKRLTTSMGTKQVKLPKSGVQVRQGLELAAITSAPCI